MDTLSSLTMVDPQAKEDKKLQQATPDTVFRVEVLRKRDHPTNLNTRTILSSPPLVAEVRLGDS